MALQTYKSGALQPYKVGSVVPKGGASSSKMSVQDYVAVAEGAVALYDAGKAIMSAAKPVVEDMAVAFNHAFHPSGTKYVSNKEFVDSFGSMNASHYVSKKAAKEVASAERALAKFERPLIGVEPNPGPRSRRMGGKIGSSPGPGISSAVAGVALGTRMVSKSPQVTSSPKGTRIRNRELVLDSIAGATDFTVQNRLPLNPGMAVTFPWLSSQAQSWQQYVCHSLRFLYIPFTNTSTTGTIMLSPNYDASASSPETEVMAADNLGTVSDVVWQAVPVPLDPRGLMGLGPKKFVRPVNVSGDIKTYDMGFLAVITDNGASSDPVGKLWVEYDFEFFLPQNGTIDFFYPSDSYVSSISPTQSFTTATPKLIVWGDPAYVIYDSLGFFAGWESGSSKLVPPAGVYKLTATVVVADTSSETFTGSLTWFFNGIDWVDNLGFYVDPVAFKVAGVAGATQTMTATAIMAFNGSTDTASLSLTLTGAAGTLTVVGGLVVASLT